MLPEKNDGSLTLYCFTPLVTLVTFVIELCFAIYVFTRYRMSAFGRLVALMLILLGTFQLSEYAVCTGGCQALWTRTAYVSITFLPVIGLHLIGMIEKRTRWIWIGYALAAGFSAVMIFTTGLFGVVSCPGRFVVFSTARAFSVAYGAYYLSGLFIGVLWLIATLRKRSPMRAVRLWMLAAYFSFMVPTFVIYVFVPTTRAGFPSVLCGFAIFNAIIATTKVAPLHEKLSK